VEFTGTNFTNSSLDGIDFSSCNIDSITVMPNDLYGVTFNNFQALEYVKLLGINISD